MAQKPNWYVNGEYLESCNCELLCPCMLSAYPPNDIMPTYVHCDLILAYYVDEGKYEDIDISGLAHMIVCYTPREMKWHNWSIAHYYDQSATPEQQEAMLQIFTGKVGGPMEDLNACMGLDLGIKPAEIKYERLGNDRKAEIPNVVVNHVVAKEGMQYPEKIVTLDNIHPQAYSVTPSVVKNGKYNDHQMVFNNDGRSALYGDIVWRPDQKYGLPSSMK